MLASHERFPFGTALQGLALSCTLLVGCETKPVGDQGADLSAGGSARDLSPGHAENVNWSHPYERLAAVIRQYDSQGIHRTGTEVDQESARWLAGLVRQAGFEPKLEEVSMKRVDTLAAYVEIDGEKLEGIPLIDSAESTDGQGITGKLGAPGSDADIAFVRYPPNVQYAPAFHALRTSDRHRALVVVTGGSEYDLPPSLAERTYELPPGYALINADRFLSPYGIPVLQLPSHAYSRLHSASSSPATVRFVSHIDRVPVSVLNVTVAVPGREPKLAPVVVMTPRSGWWQCASERGGGLAVWVDLLFRLAEEPPRRPVLFVASTGHELGHVGLSHYLEQRSELVAGAHVWIHLGANFATAVGSSVLLQASNQELLDLALGELAEHDASPSAITPLAARPLGEAREIYDGGGRYLSILGGNGLFHSPEDRWPDAVDLDLLARQAEAWASIVLELAG